MSERKAITELLKAPGASQKMSPQDVEKSKLIGLLTIVALIYQDFMVVPRAEECVDEAQADAAAKHVTDMFFGLLNACNTLFSAPGELKKAVTDFSHSLGIDVEMQVIAPSTLTKQ